MSRPSGNSVTTARTRSTVTSRDQKRRARIRPPSRKWTVASAIPAGTTTRKNPNVVVLSPAQPGEVISPSVPATTRNVAGSSTTRMSSPIEPRMRPQVVSAVERRVSSSSRRGSTGRPGSKSCSERFGNERLVAHRRTDVARVLLARGKHDRLRRQILVGDLAQQVGDHVEPGALLVVAPDHPPGSLLEVRVGEHLVLGLRVVEPSGAALEVHGRQLPALRRVVQAVLEPALLLRVGDAEPVLDQDDAAPHEHPLELGAGAQELLVLLLGAEAHDPLHAGSVVPAAVEKDDLAGGRQVDDVALEIPLSPLALGGRREGHDAREAGIQGLHDPLDRAALAGRVPTLEDDHDLEAARLDPLLPLDQLDVQASELGLDRKSTRLN